MSDQPSPISDLLAVILSRIDQRLDREKISARAACLKAGLSAGQIKTMRRQHRLGRQHGVSSSTLKRLAGALNTTPEWLTSGVGPEEPALSIFPPIAGQQFMLPLAGSVAAGVWTEVPLDKVELQQSPVPPDPRYPPSWQSAYEVRGNSVDRIARPGDFLVVVDRAAAGLSARSGDIIIVTHKKQGLEEVTARRYQQSGADCFLAFDSTDIRYAGVMEPLIQQEQDNEVIGGIAIAVYRPLMISSATS
jgi:SOS-response transcriptional repressor LexA